MSYASRQWMAATVAVMNNHSEQGQKLRSSLKSLNHGKNFLSSAPEAADLRPFFTVHNSDLGGFYGRGEDQRKQSEESLRQVMYLNCWGQS